MFVRQARRVSSHLSFQGGDGVLQFLSEFSRHQTFDLLLVTLAHHGHLRTMTQMFTAALEYTHTHADSEASTSPCNYCHYINLLMSCGSASCSCAHLHVHTSRHDDKMNSCVGGSTHTHTHADCGYPLFIHGSQYSLALHSSFTSPQGVHSPVRLARHSPPYWLQTTTAWSDTTHGWV